MQAYCLVIQIVFAGGLGNWSDRGCKMMTPEAGRVKCHCDHMTNFAVLFSASGPKTHDERHAKALSIISYVGCAVSLVGLTLTLITYSLFRYARFFRILLMLTFSRVTKNMFALNCVMR